MKCKMCATICSYAKMYSNTRESTSTLTPTECSSAHAPIRCAHAIQALRYSNNQCACQSHFVCIHKISLPHQAQTQICTVPHPHELYTTAAAAQSKTGIPGLCEVNDMSSSPHDQAAGRNLATLPTACYGYQHVCLACAEAC